MYKVVIVDDEPIIVRGLSMTIKWEEYGCVLAGTADSGEEGLELIRKVEPDILFSDICMPGMNGLQMIAAIRSERPNTQISILTGYRDFDYAQTAIKLGVSRFLLKPSNMSEIEEAIRYMTQKLDALPKDPPSEQEEPASNEMQPENDCGAGSFIVKNALDYMEENYDQKITLTELADAMYVSQWHLSKLLNKHTQKSFSQLLNEIRVEKAKQLLENVSLRVGDISEMVGFSDIAHFSRVFKKYTNMSANEYRNTQIH